MRYLFAAVLAALIGGPVVAQEKTYTLDTRTGVVSQKDVEQDNTLSDHAKEIARLKAELASIKEQVAGKTSAPVAPAVATRDPFAVAAAPPLCPCGVACPCTTPTITAPSAGGPRSSPAPAGIPSSGTARYEEPTYTLTGSTGGITSGCASGNCAAPSSFRPVRRLFGR